MNKYDVIVVDDDDNTNDVSVGDENVNASQTICKYVNAS